MQYPVSRHGSTSARTATCRSTATTTPRSTSHAGPRRCQLLPDPAGLHREIRASRLIVPLIPMTRDPGPALTETAELLARGDSGKLGWRRSKVIPLLRGATAGSRSVQALLPYQPTLPWGFCSVTPRRTVRCRLSMGRFLQQAPWHVPTIPSSERPLPGGWWRKIRSAGVCPDRPETQYKGPLSSLTGAAGSRSASSSGHRPQCVCPGPFPAGCRGDSSGPSVGAWGRWRPYGPFLRDGLFHRRWQQGSVVRRAATPARRTRSYPAGRASSDQSCNGLTL